MTLREIVAAVVADYEPGEGSPSREEVLVTLYDAASVVQCLARKSMYHEPGTTSGCNCYVPDIMIDLARSLVADDA